MVWWCRGNQAIAGPSRAVKEDMSFDLERTGRLSFSIEKRAFGWVFDLGIVISFGPRTTCQYLELIYR